MAKCTVTLHFTGYSFLLDVIRLFKTPTPEEIIKLFDEAPCLHEDGLQLAVFEPLARKIVLALHPARIDLIEKHKIKIIETKRIFGSMSSTVYTEELKKIFDATIAYGVYPTVDTHFLRWITADCTKESAGPLIDYCIEKGYLAGINESLVNAVASSLGEKIYGKLLDAGADPTVSHCDYTTRTAIWVAFDGRKVSAIRFFLERGYDLSAEIAKIPHAKRSAYGIPCDPVKKMINGILYTMADDKKTAVAQQLTLMDGPVTTQLSVMELSTGNYLFINQANQTVFGEQIPASAFAE